jgi:hypothetical protein
VGNDTFYNPGYIMFNSYINRPLIVNLVINVIGDGSFDIDYIIGDFHLDKLIIKEF